MSVFGRRPKFLEAQVTLLRRCYGSLSNAATHTRYQASIINRELLIDVLNANVTKRDAKQFLQWETKPVSNVEIGFPEIHQQHKSNDHIVEAKSHELGDPEPYAVPNNRQNFLGLICFKSPESVNDSILDGFALTLSQLVMLGMQNIIVLEPTHSGPGIQDTKLAKASFIRQAERLSQAIGKHCPDGVQTVPSAFEWIEPFSVKAPSLGPIKITIPGQLQSHLKRSSLLMVPSMAYTSSGQLLPASSKNIMASLAQHFAATQPDSRHVDRIIVVDPIGGIPNRTRVSGAHVNINLEQEFNGIEKELSEYDSTIEHDPCCSSKATIHKQHWNNLDTIRKCLAVLPPESSGLILSPSAAANTAKEEVNPKKRTGCKNVLIHNLLSNKPLVSFSLPDARVPSPSTCNTLGCKVSSPAATLVKRGFPLAIISAGQTDEWKKPANGRTEMKLDNDPRVDFPRLVHLINDSFRRKLDVPDYLDRIRNRLAGVIIVGEYEGAAILTWEQPPHTKNPLRLIPYLDKFAVLQSSQGSKCIADILFQTMVETCFPKGVCWRSRKDNPVNKWYFERSTGSWTIPHSNWTMFWTGEGAFGKDRWIDHVEVCKSIRPSWEDSRSPVRDSPTAIEAGRVFHLDCTATKPC